MCFVCFERCVSLSHSLKMNVTFEEDLEIEVVVVYVRLFCYPRETRVDCLFGLFRVSKQLVVCVSVASKTILQTRDGICVCLYVCVAFLQCV
mmetsp:Transcript_29367/g.43722  ORF Transcript_29367/g.43722 Transcript_29367/m.43722 type:complete len:92 (+) Transcript_29367:337-612(+)